MKAQILPCSVLLFLSVSLCSYAAETETAATIKQENLELRQKVRALERQLAASRSTPPRVDTEKNVIKSEPVVEEPAVRRTDRVIDNIILRRSVFDEKLTERPAEITYVHPGSGTDTYSV